MTVNADIAIRPNAMLEPATHGFSRRRFGATILAAGAGAWLSSMPAKALPASEEARVIDFEWVDPTRNRAVPARLYWPAAATRKGPVPLIVFSHGLGGSRKGYSYLGEGWSERGTASLHIQHVGSDQTLWEGNPILLLDRLDGAADEQEAIERTRDVSFGLDRLLHRDSTHAFSAYSPPGTSSGSARRSALYAAPPDDPGTNDCFGDQRRLS